MLSWKRTVSLLTSRANAYRREATCRLTQTFSQLTYFTFTVESRQLKLVWSLKQISRQCLMWIGNIFRYISNVSLLWQMFALENIQTLDRMKKTVARHYILTSGFVMNRPPMNARRHTYSRFFSNLVSTLIYKKKQELELAVHETLLTQHHHRPRQRRCRISSVGDNSWGVNRVTGDSNPPDPRRRR
jgi:hypothetical protein